MSQRDKSIIDKRSKVTPAFSSALMGVMQFDLENDVEVLEIGSWDTARVHTDFRINADF